MLKRLHLFVFLTLVHLCAAYALTAYKFSGAGQNDAFEAASTLSVLPALWIVRPTTTTRLLTWLPVNSMFWAALALTALVAIQRIIRRPQRMSSSSAAMSGSGH